MLFYITFIIIFEICLGGYRYNGRRVSESVSLIAVLFLLFVTLFRFDVGFDYVHYYNFVINERISPLQMLFLEPTARYIISFSRYVGFPPTIIIIYGLISIVMTALAIKKNSNNIPLSWMVFVGLFYLSTICFIRQGAALGIILFSYSCIRDGKFWRFLLLCSIAIALHYSSLLVLVVYILYNAFNYRKLGVIILILLPIMVLVVKLLPMLFPNMPYVSYFATAETLTGGNIAKYVFLLVNIVGLGLSWRMHSADLIKFFEIALIGTVFPFVLGGHIGGRISWYFMIFIVIALPNILKQYPISLSKLCNVAMVLCFLGMIFVSSMSSGKTQYTPYQTIFQVDLGNPKFKEE